MSGIAAWDGCVVKRRHDGMDVTLRAAQQHCQATTVALARYPPAELAALAASALVKIHDRPTSTAHCTDIHGHVTASRNLVVQRDGTDVVQVTNTPVFNEFDDWGTSPITP